MPFIALLQNGRLLGVRKAGISEATYFNWKKKSDG